MDAESVRIIGAELDLAQGKSSRDRLGRLSGLSLRSVSNVMKLIREKSLSGAMAEQSKPHAHRKKLCTEMDTAIVMKLHEDPTATLSDLRSHLLRMHHPVSVSLSTISRRLSALHYSRKRVKRVPVTRNEPLVLDHREEVGQWWISSSRDRVISLDEMGVNLHSVDSHGWSLEGEECMLTVPTNRGANLTVLAAISTTGVVAYQLLESAVTADSFARFITTKLGPAARLKYGTHAPKPVLFMDNLNVHRSASVRPVLELFFTVKFNAEYSPMLNPIEMVFADWKKRIQRSLTLEYGKEFVHSSSSSDDVTVLCLCFVCATTE